MESTAHSSPRVVTGRIAVHPRGFGFLTVELADTGEVLSAFVAPPDLNPFLADDVVSATLAPTSDGRWTATNLALCERPRAELFGEVVSRRDALYLRADKEVANTDWPLDADDVALTPGAHVVARIAVEGAERRAVLHRILAPTDDLALERVIARHGIRTEFEPPVLAEARAAARVPHALGARRDLREVPTVTVDAPSTRDIDDAISVLPAAADGALRLLVSIADVSAFVPEGTALDRAARERATSTYLAGRVLPMFPEELSAHWLSLLPGEERSCLTAELRIDPEGRVTAVDVYESLIRSWARLSYTELAEFLDHGTVLPALEPVRAALPWFRTVSSRLSLARLRRGGVEMSREETRIVMDPQTGTTAAGVESVRPTSAHELIERCMVAANEAIATWLTDRGVPVVLRAHDQPDPLRVHDLVAAARNFGYEPGFGPALTPLALAAFDHQITGATSEAALRSVFLRSLGAAYYTVRPAPHFGLAAPLYLHFTSPIRRYADLAVHRTVKQYLNGRRDFVPGDPEVEALASHINRRARAAARAETDRRRTLLAQWMSDKIGQTFSARVTRVRPFGLIAQIDTTLVEGAIPIETLPEGPYQPDARETALVSPARTFAIGAQVTVRVVSTEPALGRVEFALAE